MRVTQWSKQIFQPQLTKSWIKLPRYRKEKWQRAVRFDVKPLVQLRNKECFVLPRSAHINANYSTRQDAFHPDKHYTIHMTTAMHKNRSSFNGDDTRYKNNKLCKTHLKTTLFPVLPVKIQLISTTRRVMFWNISLRTLQMKGTSATEKQV